MGGEVEAMRQDIKNTLGFVPGFLEEMTYEDRAADILWDLMGHYDLGESNIPMKWKHLIGYAVAAAIHCPYCTPFHKAAAQMGGATELELKEAALHALKISGFSAFLHGREYPVDKFKEELAQVVNNLTK